jgi:hypothetical protein
VKDVDLAAYLDMTPEERVVWEGRACVGARWPSWPRVLLLALLLWVVLVGGIALLFALDGHGGGALARRVQQAAPVLVAVPAAFLVMVGGSKLVGPTYTSLLVTALAGSTFAAYWIDLVGRRGMEGALERLGVGEFVAALLFLGLPLVVIVERLTWRLATVYVMTDRQVAAFWLREGKRPWRLWTEPLWLKGSLRARLDRSWRCPEGWIVVGERELDLRGEDAARALDEVRAAKPRWEV